MKAKNPTFFEDGDDSFVVYAHGPIDQLPFKHRKGFMLLTSKGTIEIKDKWFNRGKTVYGLMENNLIAAEITYDDKKPLSEELTPISARNFPFSPRVKLREDQNVWRYVGYKKLVDLLESGTLYLCRIDRFADPLEGISSDTCKVLIREDERFDEEKAERQINLMEKRFQENRNSTFTSCWHINDTIDLEMWNEYSKYGFCIETNIKSLTASLDNAGIPIHIEPIRYFKEPYYNQEVYWFPTLFKRWEYRHERELRISTYGYNLGSFECIRPPINIKALIQTIHIHPQCSQITIDRVRKKLKELNFQIPLKRYI
ncbi:hypothetical protein SAMN04488034_101796 [Salinimicrobium catena]|uniref:DUF2971 domain-containing protein n=1 Tax=Salinimicrobium catena TaxID=390640 RepID=A0A1H5JN31_9FLAO|nr:DUF2971 domain-containing protein [Salinimicrobium catena]SDL83790.1 hypothetical protein SAMN04488140_11612 [Salinimicrobium catena]SEE53985.1 hypothetical protein SAMN04488034_101796 [Salinimicrobium catena]